MSIIAFQPTLRPPLPLIKGSADFLEERRLFERIDSMLTESKLDAKFLELSLKDRAQDLAKASAHRRAVFGKFSFVCLRANIARKLTGLAHREFCVRLADSPLLQWFLHVGQLDQVQVFSKSTSHRFDKWLKSESIELINDALIARSILKPEQLGAPQPFGLEQAIVVDEAFFDTTCVKTAMHFPTDWVLLRDAVRTLMSRTQ